MHISLRSIALACLAIFALPVWSQACDVDTDGDVDRIDINLILAARNQPADPGDSRDADGDGVITVKDGRTCVAQCTLSYCEILTPGGDLVWDQGNWDEENWQ